MGLVSNILYLLMENLYSCFSGLKGCIYSLSISGSVVFFKTSGRSLNLDAPCGKKEEVNIVSAKLCRCFVLFLSLFTDLEITKAELAATAMATARAG